MRCPRCYGETSADVLCCPNCKLPTPKGRSAKTKVKEPAPIIRKARKKKSKPKSDSRQVRPLVAVIVCISAVIVFGVGSYFVMAFVLSPPPVDPGSPQYAIEKLRSLPSNQQGLTVDERLEQEVRKSREAGRLVEVEAWSVKPVNQNKYIVSYSIQEKNDRFLKAEWSVDLASGIITPQSDLATEVYNR